MRGPLPRGTPWTEADLAGMRRALAEAAVATTTGDVPVGAVVLAPDGEVLATGRNVREARADPTGHAEIVALRAAGTALRATGTGLRAAGTGLGGWRLAGCTLVVTLEPCTMCAGAIVLARVDRLVFGAWDDKAGAAGSVRDVVRDSRLNHRVEVVGGVLAADSTALLRSFFGRAPDTGSTDRPD